MTTERILKSCPQCGPATPLIKRTNRHNGSEFLGCTRYPECNHTEEIPEWYRLVDAGHQMLPGFGAKAND